ncbi:hypothetical protein K501DRAFT_274211 [Backusella circina FSU 941]|nr:hypothetical protein K501DRAFT_274211 [Backusella circina FSU 941]
MREFPAEVLAIVFSHLESTDKVELMTVCRLWSSTIENCNVLHTIRLTNVPNLCSLVRLLSYKSYLGDQAENLVIETGISANTKDMSVLPLLPNLKVLYTSSYPQLLLDGQLNTEFLESRVERLIINLKSSDVTSPLRAVSPLPMIRFPNLRTLTVNCKYFPKDNLMTLIHYAPTVSELTLSSFIIEFDMMEYIHLKLSSLTSLIIYDSTLRFTQTPVQITPARSITLFHSIFEYPAVLSGWHMEFHYLTYINSKYPNVTDFTFYSNVHHFPPMIPSHLFLADPFHDIFNDSDPKLKKLNFHRAWIPSPYLKYLDGNGYQLEELTMFNGLTSNLIWNLLRSNQANSIKKLTLKKIQSPLPSQLRFMPMLVNLTLDFGESRATPFSCIRDIIELCPVELKSLSLKNIALHNEEDRLVPLVSLEKLHLTSVIFDLNVDSNINEAFPNTKTLILDQCFFPSNALILSNFDLLNLEVIRRRMYWSKYMSIRTLNDNAEHTYTVGYRFADYAALDKYREMSQLPLHPPTKRVYNLPNRHSRFLVMECFTARNVVLYL